MVRLLVAMLEPSPGHHVRPVLRLRRHVRAVRPVQPPQPQLSFVGQESKDFTWRLCPDDLFIHGLDGNIALGNSSRTTGTGAQGRLRPGGTLPSTTTKGQEGWGANAIASKDGRLRLLGGEPITLSPRNANTMWMMHFLHHLKDGGTAGFVMATGELSNGELARGTCVGG